MCCCRFSRAQNPLSPRHDNFYEELRRNLVPAPARKISSKRRLRAFSWPELTEHNAHQWGAFASDGAATDLSDDTTNVKMGASSLLFTTKSGFDTGVRFPKSGAMHLDLTTKNRFVFWAFGRNTNSYEFQGNQPVVVLRCKGGDVRFEPNQPVMSNNSWRFYSIPLLGNAVWTRTDSGTPDLSDVLSLEIHHDTWGEGFSVLYDGVAFRGGPSVPVSPAPNAALDVVSPRVLLYCFDPIMENVGGVRQHQTHGWTDPRVLIPQILADLKRDSHGAYQPQIVDTIIADEHPYFEDGFQHTDESFEVEWSKPQGQRDFHFQSTFDYARFAREHNIVARIESGDLDEVWFYTAPIAGTWEAAMAGDGAYYVNGYVQKIPCKRAFVFMSFGFERGVAEAIHGFGHRSESTLARQYGGWPANQSTPWSRFTLLHKQAPGLGGVGNVHFPVNGTADYDYFNSTQVPSQADDWANFPAFQNTTRVFGCEEWGPSFSFDDSHRGYLNWWFNHFPHGAGVAPDGFLRSWWRTMGDVDQFKDWDGNLSFSENTVSVSLASPTEGAAVSGVVRVEAAAEVDGALGHVDFYVDGVFEATDSLAPYTFSWNTNGKSGLHRLGARAVELASGNEAVSAPILVNVGELPVARFSVSDATALESGAHIAFSVSREGDLSGASSVDYATKDGGASNGSDYNQALGTLLFAPGQASQTVLVPVANDDEIEKDETFFLDLSAPTDALLGRTRGTATIQNDDTEISILGASAPEGNANAPEGEAKQLEFAVSLHPPVPVPVVVTYTTRAATEPNAATPGDDFPPVSGTVRFEPNQKNAAVSVPIIGDSLFEADEVLFLDVALENGNQASATGEIENDDAAPLLALTAPAPTTEGNSEARDAVFSLALSKPSALPVSVVYAASSGAFSPAAPDDFLPTAGTLVFALGEALKTIAVPVRGDTLDEPNETFDLALSGCVGATLFQPGATATITDDDTSRVSLGSARVVEGNSHSNPTRLRFPISLSAPNSRKVTFKVSTFDATVPRATAKTDYVPLSSMLEIPAGQTSAWAEVVVLADTLDEDDEQIGLALASVQNAVLATSRAQGTVQDDDATVNIGIKDITIPEGNRASFATFVVSLSAPSGRVVSLDFTTQNELAREGTDFTPTRGALVFAPGQTQKTIRIPIVGDRTLEKNERFLLKISGLQNARISRTFALCTLLNDDK